MTRTVIGVLLLLLLLAAGIWTATELSRQSEALAIQLDSAAQLILSADFQEARALTRNVRERWEEILPVHGVFADHDPLDAIAQTFRRLELYEQAGDPMGCALACGDLAEQFRTLGESFGVQWWNIL